MTRAQYLRRSGRSSKWIRRTTRVAIHIRDGFRCQYCNKNLRDARPCDMGLDHLKPQIEGGSNDPSNLVTACRRCNSARQDRAWWSFASPTARTRIMKARRRVLNRELARAMVNGDVDWADCR